MIRVAINGYGRIGRNILRALFSSKYFRQHVQIVAINDLGSDLEVHKHLTKYDSVHGKFMFDVELDKQALLIDNDNIQFMSCHNIGELPWNTLAIDIVFECTGVFTHYDKAYAHIKAGAKKVLLSAPGKGDIDATIVYGVNHTILTSSMQVVSNASCTTNCLAPIVNILHENWSVKNGFMSTIHSYTNDQVLLDKYHKDLYRARSTFSAIIPTKTGAAEAVSLVLPELSGCLDGVSIRVPTANVSLVDLTCTLNKPPSSLEDIQKTFKSYSNSEPLKGILTICEEKLVSVDFYTNPASSIVDIAQIKLKNDLVQVFAWYDNEWGFSNRMLDTAIWWYSC